MKTFLQRRHTDGQRDMKTCSTLLIVGEMQIISIMRYHPTLVRRTDIKTSTNNKCWRGCGEKGILLHSWWECKLVQSQWRTVWRFLIKLKTELPYDLAIPLLGIYLERTVLWKDTCTPMFTIALFTIGKTWSEWNNALFSNIEGPRDDHTNEVSQVKTIHDITYMWNLKKWYRWTFL